MDQAANILSVVSQIWTNSGISSILVPGGLVFESVYSGTTYPYAMAEIELNDVQFTSGHAYCMQYILTITTYSNNTTGVGSNVEAIQIAIYEMFPSTLSLETVSGSDYINPFGSVTMSTILICPMPGGVREDKERNIGVPSILTKNKFSIQISVNRR